MKSSTDDHEWRQVLGLPKALPFLSEPAPRKPDRSQIQALYEGTLKPSVEADVWYLIQCYRDWAAENERVLCEVLENTDWDSIIPDDATQSTVFLAAIDRYLLLSLRALMAEFAPFQLAHRGGNPLDPYLPDLKRIISTEWCWSTQKLRPEMSDPATVTAELVEVLAASKLQIPYPLPLVAATLVKSGLDRLC